MRFLFRLSVFIFCIREMYKIWIIGTRKKIKKMEKRIKSDTSELVENT